jgi:hypothetical protein
VIDRQPRTLSAQQAEALGSLGRLIMTQLELRRVSAELAGAAANLKTLAGLLPICSYCKGIRDDQGYWRQVEAYLKEHTDARFTHGICPTCLEKHFPEYNSRKPDSGATPAATA